MVEPEPHLVLLHCIFFLYQDRSLFPKSPETELGQLWGRSQAQKAKWKLLKNLAASGEIPQNDLQTRYSSKQALPWYNTIFLVQYFPSFWSYFTTLLYLDKSYESF